MSEPVTVAVDANGADLGPAEVAAGAALAAQLGHRVLVFGPAAEIGDVPAGVEVIDAPVSIAKAPEPARAVRSTPDASIVQAARAVAEGSADALVAAGSTGSALAAGLFHIRRGRGIHRPALALPIPIPGAPVLLLDVGANVESRADHLVQFAYMGSAFAAAVLGVEEPRVGLLSNGEEPSKGTPDVVAAHVELDRGTLNFVGNVEGTSVMSGAADVVVTDGFTGNVALKLMEGVSAVLMKRDPRPGHVVEPGQGRGRAHASRARGAARRDRPRGPGRGVSARPAPDRGGAARAVHPHRLCQRHRRGREGGLGAGGGAHARSARGRRGAPGLVRASG